MVADGTVTVLLGALSGEAIHAEPLRTAIPASASIAAAAAQGHSRAVFLRGQQSGAVYCFARSLLLPARLPAAFLPTLRRAPGGIGAAFETLELETRRVLAWRGRRAAPAIPDGAGSAGDAFGAGCLARSYAIHHGGRAAVVIEENFPADLAL